MLILKRRIGGKIYAGFNLTREDTESSADVVLTVADIRDSLLRPEVQTDVVWYGEDGKRYAETFVFDARERKLVIGELSIQILDVQGKIFSDRVQPFASFGFVAPPDLKVVREEVEVL